LVPKLAFRHARVRQEGVDILKELFACVHGLQSNGKYPFRQREISESHTICGQGLLRPCRRGENGSRRGWRSGASTALIYPV
jgi:hypothetical protein